MLDWTAPIQTAWDVVGLGVFVVVFPLYHFLYPAFARRRPSNTARGRFDILRESWIERILERGDVITAAQQTRNLTMVNSILVSSALILIGIVSNMLLRIGDTHAKLIDLGAVGGDPDVLRIKLYGVLAVLVMAFSYFMTALRHLGNFVLLIGADPKLVEEQVGPPVQYFAGLINRASHRYTLGVRSFYAATPLLAWLFDSRLFIAVSVLWGLKFFVFQDFGSPLPRARD